MTGIELIVKERQEQIEKHGFCTIYDVNSNSYGGLLKGALFVLTERMDDYPPEWNTFFLEKLGAKRGRMTAWEYQIERLKIAGALLAAEIDRLQNIKD